MNDTIRIKLKEGMRTGVFQLTLDEFNDVFNTIQLAKELLSGLTGYDLALFKLRMDSDMLYNIYSFRVDKAKGEEEEESK